MVRHAVKVLKKYYGFQQTCPIACGGNEVVTHVRCGEITLYVCWDIWCGFDITARSEESNFIIADLAVYFDGIIQHPKFGKYFDVH
jgi:predicted amidohydrolase